MRNSLNQQLFKRDVRCDFRILILLLKVDGLPFVHHSSFAEKVVVNTKFIQFFERPKSALLLKGGPLSEIENAVRPRSVTIVYRHEIILKFIHSLRHFCLRSIFAHLYLSLLLVIGRNSVVKIKATNEAYSRKVGNLGRRPNILLTFHHRHDWDALLNSQTLNFCFADVRGQIDEHCFYVEFFHGEILNNVIHFLKFVCFE